MRKVVEKSEVAHLWANKVQDEARVSGGNFYFYGETIYSYGSHFPIAVHHKDVVLVTLRTYSNTTASHIWEVKSATSHLNRLFCLHPKDAKGGFHEANLKYWFDCIQDEKSKLIRARKPEIYIANIQGYVDQLTKYVEYFSIKLTKDQKASIAILGKDEYIKQASERIAKAEKAEKAKMRLGKKMFAVYVESWHSYTVAEVAETLTAKEREAGTYYRNSLNNVPTWLRTNGEIIETSKGIKLPVNIGKRYYEFYLKTLANGGCNANCNYKMLEYTVTSITDSGLVVGCHDIPASEIKAIAEKLGWA